MENQEEVQKLKWRIESLEEDLKEHRDVVKLYQTLTRDKAIYVNTYQRDCDGVEGYYSYKFTNLDDYFKQKRFFFEQEFEGSHSWDVVALKDAYKEFEQGNFGQGWDIH